jgi:hypothetical protein
MRKGETERYPSHNKRQALKAKTVKLVENLGDDK